VRRARRAHRAVGRGRLAAQRLGVRLAIGGGRDWREREVASVVARELLRQARGPGERPGGTDADHSAENPRGSGRPPR
jgi:hypothetical protein